MLAAINHTLSKPVLIKYPGESLTAYASTPLRKPAGTYMRLNPGHWVRRRMGNKGEIWKAVKKLPKEIHLELLLMGEPPENSYS